MRSDSTRNGPSASAEQPQERNPQAVPADKGIRVVTSEVAEDLKKKADTKFEAELEAKLRLGNKQNEKAFRDAMIGSPLGGLYEAASVARHEGKTEITIDISLRWRVED